MSLEIGLLSGLLIATCHSNSVMYSLAPRPDFAKPRDANFSALPANVTDVKARHFAPARRVEVWQGSADRQTIKFFQSMIPKKACPRENRDRALALTLAGELDRDLRRGFLQ